MKNVSQGSVVRLTATFKGATDVLTDPSVVAFAVETEADSGTDSYTYGAAGSPIVRDSTGVYHFDQDTSDMSGIYDWRIVGTAAGNMPTQAKQGQFYVAPANPDDDDSDCSDD